MKMPKHGLGIIIRSRCILVRDGKVLLQREKNGVYSIPGGRVEFLESLPFTVIREMKEEAGIEVLPERLVYIVETLNERKGRPRHEILFYFKCTHMGGEPRREFKSIRFEWRDPLEVRDSFWPPGLAERISSDMPTFPRAYYIVHVEDELKFINTFTDPILFQMLPSPGSIAKP